MGSEWSQNDRKILVFTFNEFDSSKAIKYLTEKVNIDIKTDVGFEVINIKHKKHKLKLWFLQSLNRHLWIHHFIGTEGVIFYIGNKTDVKDINTEIIFILKSDKIKETKILFVFEMADYKKLIDIEKLRKDISFLEEINLFVNYLFVSGNDYKFKNREIELIFDWVCSDH